jgi:hypothetical protein
LLTPAKESVIAGSATLKLPPDTWIIILDGKRGQKLRQILHFANLERDTISEIRLFVECQRNKDSLTETFNVVFLFVSFL